MTGLRLKGREPKDKNLTILVCLTQITKHPRERLVIKRIIDNNYTYVISCGSPRVLGSVIKLRRNCGIFVLEESRLTELIVDMKSCHVEKRNHVEGC